MTSYVDLHTHKASSDENVVSVVNLDSSEMPCGKGLFSIGIHPWSLDNPGFDVETAFADLERKLGDSRIVALGEAGLDRVHSATMPLQMEVFERQVALSERYKLPVIIHNVRCTAELVSLRKHLKPKQQWVVHGFGGGLEEAVQLVNQGFMLSVGAALLDERRKIAKALKDIGLSNIFFETDTSDISIIKVYEKAAELLGMSVPDLCDDVWSRFEDVFSRC